ncbi:MAG: hypothetical protein WC657_06175 [Candidatus Paceibacterota bacterium]|jgi:chromosome segregation ATPase
MDVFREGDLLLEIKALRKELENVREISQKYEDRYFGLRHEHSLTEAELEQLRVQLAGCGAAALGATKDPAKQGDYGWSAAYQDVLNLRLELERVTGELATAMRIGDAMAKTLCRAGIELAASQQQLKEEAADRLRLALALDDSQQRIRGLEYALENVRAEADGWSCEQARLEQQLAEMTTDRDEWRQLSCEQHGDGMVAGTQIYNLEQQVKSLTIELEAAVEVRRNVTKELTEYGDRACKAERERDIAIRGNGEAHYKLNLAEQQNGRLRELCNKAIECAEHGDYSNGIVGPEGSPDEGRVRSWEYINDLKKQIAALSPVSPNITEHIGDATRMIEPDNSPVEARDMVWTRHQPMQKRQVEPMSPKPTSGTCQADPSDMLKQGFKEAGIDVDFVDCTPKPEKEQTETVYGGWHLCGRCRKPVTNGKHCDCQPSQDTASEG